MGLRGSGQSDRGSPEAVARTACGAALRAGQRTHEIAWQSGGGGGPSSGRSIVLDAEEAGTLSGAEVQTKCSFVDARVSATAPWLSKPRCECETRLAGLGSCRRNGVWYGF